MSNTRAQSFKDERRESLKMMSEARFLDCDGRQECTARCDGTARCDSGI